jgi:hypothetical protein
VCPRTITSRRYGGPSCGLHCRQRRQRDSAETAPRVGRVLRQRAAGRKNVEDLHHQRGVAQVASDVHVVGPARFKGAGAGGVDAVDRAVGHVVGQRARFDDAVQPSVVPVPAGAAARRDRDLAEHVIGAVLCSLPQHGGAGAVCCSAEAVAGATIEPTRVAAVNKTPRVRIPVPLHAMGELTERINNQ